MQRILDLRIVRWQFKLLYIVGAWLVLWPFNYLARAAGSGEFLISLMDSAIDIAAILLGARIYRGSGEPIAPSRPWWKMTARRRLSRVLGVLSLLALLLGVTNLVAAAFGVEASLRQVTHRGIATSIADTLFWLPIAFLYLNSAARLGKPLPFVREPRLKPPMKLE